MNCYAHNQSTQVVCRRAIHDCRHHALSVLAESGAPDVVIKAVGGHVTDEAMEIYRHARDDAKRKWTDALGESYTDMIQ